jgi:hypothetical protein
MTSAHQCSDSSDSEAPGSAVLTVKLARIVDASARLRRNRTASSRCGNRTACHRRCSRNSARPCSRPADPSTSRWRAGSCRSHSTAVDKIGSARRSCPRSPGRRFDQPRRHRSHSRPSLQHRPPPLCHPTHRRFPQCPLRPNPRQCFPRSPQCFPHSPRRFPRFPRCRRPHHRHSLSRPGSRSPRSPVGFPIPSPLRSSPAPSQQRARLPRRHSAVPSQIFDGACPRHSKSHAPPILPVSARPCARHWLRLCQPRVDLMAGRASLGRRYCGAGTSSAASRNAHWSAISSMRFSVGMPAPCPARVSMRIRIGAAPAWACWSAAANL